MVKEQVRPISVPLGIICRPPYVDNAIYAPLIINGGTWDGGSIGSKGSIPVLSSDPNGLSETAHSETTYFTNNGTLQDADAPLTFSVTNDFTNTGTVHFSGQSSASVNAPNIINDGQIYDSEQVNLTGSISGSGTIVLEPNADLNINGAVASAARSPSPAAPRSWGLPRHRTALRRRSRGLMPAMQSS